MYTVINLIHKFLRIRLHALRSTSTFLIVQYIISKLSILILMRYYHRSTKYVKKNCITLETQKTNIFKSLSTKKVGLFSQKDRNQKSLQTHFADCSENVL